MKTLNIGERLKTIRKSKRITQADIQKRIGLSSSYISRVETGDIVPSVETLEKLARALDLPLYQLFYDGADKPPLPRNVKNDHGWDLPRSRHAKLAARIERLLQRMTETDRQFLVGVAAKIARSKRRKIK